MNRRELFIAGATLFISENLGILPCCSAFAQGAEQAPDKIRFCTELLLDDLDVANELARAEFTDNDAGETKTKAAALNKRRWNPKRRILNVDFLTQPSYLDRVIAKARTWEQYIGLSFRFSRGTPDVLVSFEPGGSASLIGTDSLSCAQKGRPSMNFGWFSAETDDTEFGRTTIHEFGHALGLIHEHQHPEASIPWNKPAVYAYYKKLGWDKAAVDENIFKKYDSSQLNYTHYDPTSIMHYPVPKDLLTDPSAEVGWNTKLSALDEQFISSFYPKSASSIPQ